MQKVFHTLFEKTKARKINNFMGAGFPVSVWEIHGKQMAACGEVMLSTFFNINLTTIVEI